MIRWMERRLGLAPTIVTVRATGIRTVWPTTCPLEQELLEQINAYRLQQGRPPWRLSTVLVHAARDHSLAMGRQEFFAHQDPQGRGPGERITDAGYGLFRVVAENIAMGTRTPAETLRAWIASPRHHELLLDRMVTEAGIGMAEQGRQRYWTLDCASPR